MTLNTLMGNKPDLPSLKEKGREVTSMKRE